MSLLRSLTRRADRTRKSLDEILAAHLPSRPGPAAFGAWVAALSEKYDVPRETLLCAIIEMTDMPADQKLELQNALKAIRDSGQSEQAEQPKEE